MTPRSDVLYLTSLLGKAIYQLAHPPILPAHIQILARPLVTERCMQGTFFVTSHMLLSRTGAFPCSGILQHFRYPFDSTRAVLTYENLC